MKTGYTADDVRVAMDEAMRSGTRAVDAADKAATAAVNRLLQALADEINILPPAVHAALFEASRLIVHAQQLRATTDAARVRAKGTRTLS